MTPLHSRIYLAGCRDLAKRIDTGEVRPRHGHGGSLLCHSPQAGSPLRRPATKPCSSRNYPVPSRLSAFSLFFLFLLNSAFFVRYLCPSFDLHGAFLFAAFSCLLGPFSWLLLLSRAFSCSCFLLLSLAFSSFSLASACFLLPSPAFSYLLPFSAFSCVFLSITFSCLFLLSHAFSCFCLLLLSLAFSWCRFL